MLFHSYKKSIRKADLGQKSTLPISKDNIVGTTIVLIFQKLITRQLSYLFWSSLQPNKTIHFGKGTTTQDTLEKC